MNDAHRPLPEAAPDVTHLADRAGITPDAAWEAAVEQWAGTRQAPARLAAILGPDDAPAFDPLPPEPEA